MAGKAYTMQELRDIVSYLVERGAYSETRARSMWQEFANCGRTKRTWQSLKETFLKRILPDIHNPYYKLTETQITSFRAGTDISKMSGNRLELREVGESSKSHNENTNNVAQEKSTLLEVKGENFVINQGSDASTVRSSTETVVLDTAENFAVAEEVILSLTEKEKEQSTPSSPNKSLKDMIIFKEPLTPMMQCLVGDCESDGSNFSESDNQLSVENGIDAVSATASTADTFLPNNQEGNNVTSDTTHPSNANDVTSGPKTRSQAEQNTTAPRSVLKNGNKKGEVSQEPVKKKVRLNDTVSSDGGVGTSRNENGLMVDKTSHKSSSRGHNARMKSKKEQSIKSSVGEISSVAELIAILTDSVLPNNQEGIKVLKKFLETQGENSEKPDTLSEDTTTIDNKTNNTQDAASLQEHSYSRSSETSNQLEPEDKITTRNAKKIKEIAASESTDTEMINIDSDGEKLNEDKRVTRKTQKKNDAKNLAVHKVDSESLNSSKIIKSNKTLESAEDGPEVRTTRTKRKNAEDNVKDIISIQSHDTLSAVAENFGAHSSSPVIGQSTLGLREKKEATPTKEDQQEKTEKLNDDFSSNGKKAGLSPSPKVEPPKAPPQENDSPQGNETDKKKNTECEITQTDDGDLIIVDPYNSEHEKVLTDDKQIESRKPKDIEKNSTKPDMESSEIRAKDIEDDITSNKSVKINEVTEKVSTEHQEGTSEIPASADKILNSNVESPQDTNFCTAMDNVSDLPCGNACLQNATAEETQKENRLRSVHSKKNGRTVVLLPSHSDSDSEASLEVVQRPKRSLGARGANVLSRIFGLCDGNVHNRRRHARNAARERYRSETSESSNEEQADEDLIPIPRPGRRVRYMRRPIEGRVEALPEGTLVAVCGGRVYKIVAQRGRRVYNLSYSNPDERKQTEPPCHADPKPNHSISQHNDAPSTSAGVGAPAPTTAAKTTSEERIPPEVVAPNPQLAAPSCDQASVVLTKDKITFSGNADKIISMLPHFPSVMKGLFGSEKCVEIGADEAGERPEPKDENKLNDEEIRVRVEEREAEIFREIAERDAAACADNLHSSEEAQPKTEEPQQRPKSARRKRPPKKISPEAAELPSRNDDDVEHVSESDHEIIIQEDGRKRGAPGEGAQLEEGRKRRNRRPKQDTEEASAQRLSDSDDEVRYSLPSQATTARSIWQRGATHRPPKLRAKEYEESSQDLEESTQGYLDSDITLIEFKPKRRRKSHQLDFSRRRSVTLARERSRKSYSSRPNVRRNSLTKLQVLRVLSSGDENLQDRGTEELSSEKEVAGDSDESVHLTPIPESVGSAEVSLPGLDTVPESKYVKDAGNSSNVSLPPSPEISIVENISVRSSSLCRNNHCHTINEQLTMPDNHEKKRSRKVSILLDDINFSCPLMEQDLAITSGVTSEQTSQRVSNRSSIEEMELCVTDLNEYNEGEGNTSKSKGSGVTVTESLLSKVIDININDTPFSESMQNGIVNLRLNSENRDHPEDGKSPKISAKGKSRCSTPNKKTKFRKSQPPMIGSVIEEESMQVEYCSKKKRQSCPPVIDIDSNEKPILSNFKMPNSHPARTKKPEIVVTPAETSNVTLRKWKIRTPKTPKPKIIKVKILKPKSNTAESPKKASNKDENKHSNKGESTSLPSRAPKSKKSNERKSSSSQNSTNSACSSAELIHNHSDTCLAAQECMPRDSESEANASDSGVALRRHVFTPSPDCFSSEAQDGNANLETASLSSPSAQLSLSNIGSLLTEETIPSRSSSWYLLSEDEEESLLNSDRRLSHKEEDDILLAKYGSHIASLYPRACAVPELSTITENSSDTRGSAVKHHTTPTCSVDGLSMFSTE